MMGDGSFSFIRHRMFGVRVLHRTMNLICNAGRVFFMAFDFISEHSTTSSRQHHKKKQCMYDSGAKKEGIE